MVIRKDSPIDKRKLKKKLGAKCIYCGCNSKLFLTIDHRVPLVRGGKDDNSNKQVCCILCNVLKANHTDSEFKKIVRAYSVLKDLAILKVGYKLFKGGLDVDIGLNHYHYPDFKHKEVKEDGEGNIGE